MMATTSSAWRAAVATVSRRGLHTRRKVKNSVDLPQALVANFPTKKVEPPSSAPDQDPDYYNRNPVTSAHAIDLEKGQLSTLDSVALSPSGSVVHGRYGELPADAVAGTPLEYLALLRMAAEGAAGLAKVSKQQGTLLVYGASQANGFAAVQLAVSEGHAVVGVVDAQHSCHADMVEYVKAMIPEPGTAVAEEYAMAKKNFADLVSSVSTGNEGLSCYDAKECLEDFKANLLAYAEKYPDTMPAAVDASKMKFLGMEKDKDQFRANMEAYLAQFPPGSPPMDKQQLETYFTSEQYEIFRTKFWEQTSSVISGDESHFFSPPHIVQDLMKTPEKKSDSLQDLAAFPKIPFSFTTVNNFYPAGTEQAAGGPVVGAIISVTPNLKTAAEAVNKAKTLREKAEALQFLTTAQKDAFRAASSVVAMAKEAGAPVITVGGTLPGFETAEPTDADVQTALSAMAIQDDGTTKLDYFVQAYRAGDFPFYADYAVHRATEVLAGPRQIVVTK
mmetsp:Transcript_16942/g.27497  ORF Transcript_16942/g.27497 Transcript_16942/m.27497 type:complete len:503 (-) Transcript_16942:379-1887(-)|eukprot:CAMPEP_0178833702 /NCGR_PEP_ID=MMETSP0746-20121128/10693_1 /TAXON_ID=913974 /ORGANISM="Nitzschia punctata, Strain CCMP561" /LENGTH=502 /DNA_ID=CAMNT_0020496145 /DNA_START=237 /DNA_END=1745 /DNA_ORIENTATION=-